jgi:hypothetical protein
MNVPVKNTASANALAALGGLKANLQNVATSIVTPGGDFLLRLVQGAWVYGAENVEVEDGSEWAVNPLSLQHGYVAWSDYKKKKNEILAEVMVPAGQPLPHINELREVKDDEGNVCEYKHQIGFQLQCLTGADAGEQVLYKPTSIGGLNACKDLLNAIIEQLDKDIENPVAVLTLEVDSYIHKVYGKTMVPVLTIVDWVPLDDAIKAPIDTAAEPDADLKEGAQNSTAERVRSRQQAPAGETRAASREEISAADRQAALDGELADLAAERQAERARQRQAEQPDPAAAGRTRRRR